MVFFCLLMLRDIIDGVSYDSVKYYTVLNDTLMQKSFSGFIGISLLQCSFKCKTLQDCFYFTYHKETAQCNMSVYYPLGTPVVFEKQQGYEVYQAQDPGNVSSHI